MSDEVKDDNMLTTSIMRLAQELQRRAANPASIRIFEEQMRAAVIEDRARRATPAAPAVPQISSMDMEQANRIAKNAEGKFAHQDGMWVLTSPDGRAWTGDSPLAAVKAERDERIPASVQLARVLSAADEPEAAATVVGDEQIKAIYKNSYEENWDVADEEGAVIFAREILALAASPAAVVVPTGWLPIESAPKDGTHIMVSWPMRLMDDEGVPSGAITRRDTLVTWMNGSAWIEPDYLGASGEWFGDDDCYASDPDYWMPLPDASALVVEAPATNNGVQA